MARERVEYADEHGDAAACEHFNIRQATLERYKYIAGGQENKRGEFADILRGKERVNWADHPHLYGDWLVLNDLHVPFIDFELMDKALDVARLMGIRQVAILGDFVDCEAISRFDFGADTFSIMEELQIARDFLAQLQERFDRVFLLRGNHDERIIKFLKKVKRLYEKDDEYAAYHTIVGVDYSKAAWEHYRDFFQSAKVEVSNYASCEFEGKYIGVHPSNYSRNAPTVEKKLCNKYLKHVIGTHGHLSAIAFHDSAKFFGIQLGGMLDGDLIFYKNMRVTTHPDWMPGFGWIKDKKLGYYFDHPDLMNIFDYIALAEAAV